jgi:hypothetical protein
MVFKLEKKLMIWFLNLKKNLPVWAICPAICSA